MHVTAEIIQSARNRRWWVTYLQVMWKPWQSSLYSEDSITALCN